MANILHGIAELVTIIGAFLCGMFWVIKRIEKGQKTIVAEHKKDFKSVKKELKKRVSVAECDRLRSQCPCNQIAKGKIEK